MAAAIGVLAIVAHDRWRRDGWKTGAVAGPGVFALALATGESAVATAGWVLAHALFLDRGPMRARIAAVAPYAVLVVAWRLAWGALGCGVHGSGLYVDPGEDPIAFVRAVVTRAPFLILGQMALPPSDLWVAIPEAWEAGLAAVAVAVLGAMGAVLWPLFRNDPVARFLAAGMVLSVVPPSASFPADRLLFFAGVGGMGLVARHRAALAGGAIPATGLARALAAVFLVVHAILAPLLFVPRSLMMAVLGTQIEAVSRAAWPGPGLSNRDLVVLNSPNDLHGLYPPLLWRIEGVESPRRSWLLSAGMQAVELRREDDHTLVLKPSMGIPARAADRLQRGARYPFLAGDSVRLGGVGVEVREVTEDGQAALVAFRFDVPLDDPSLCWLAWEDGALRPYRLPTDGNVRTIAEPELMEVLHPE